MIQEIFQYIFEIISEFPSREKGAAIHLNKLKSFDVTMLRTNLDEILK
jgi:hypothetical protein